MKCKANTRILTGRSLNALEFEVLTLAATGLLVLLTANPSLAAEAKSAPEKLLQSRGLHRQQGKDGGVWVLAEEAELAAFLAGKGHAKPTKKGQSAGKKLRSPEAVLADLRTFDEFPDHVSFFSHSSEIEKQFRALEDKTKLAAAVRAYRGLGNQDEVADYNDNMFPAFVKFHDEKLIPTRTKAAHLNAYRNAIIGEFNQAYGEPDDLAKAIRKKYRALKKDVAVRGAIETIGGRLGPSREFAVMRGTLKRISGDAQVLKVTLKRVKFANSLFDFEMDDPFVKDIDPEKDPVAYLEARGFEKQDGVWGLPAENMFPKIMDEANKYDKVVKKLKSQVTRKRRKKIEKGTELLHATRSRLDAEQKKIFKDAFTTGAFDGAAYARWQEKKGKEMRLEWKIRDEVESLSAADDKFAVAWGDRQNFLQMAVDQAIVIAERYG